ncbi:isopenicillin N synthase family dioxygenase [Candidatus Poriferisocius sp.]|uniref:isopenicillin N synthase family dioxygenase n=1 Tax=Candidatus Poriferisocius sp. TaxID=3101276 RepID=UPI003B02A28E
MTATLDRVTSPGMFSRIPVVDPGVFSRIPVLDLEPLSGSSEQRQELAEELGRICHEIGFLLVVNHGVSAGLRDAIFDMMHRFFALPGEQKAMIDKRRSPHFRGWEPVGAEYTNHRPDIREQIDWWTEWPARPKDVEPYYLRLLGPNQWLPDDVLPGNQELTKQWFDELGGLANRLMRLLSLGLGLAEDYLEQYFGDETMSLAKFIHYPPTPEGSAGVNAHHDTGFLTVLDPGPTAGLQVQNQAGQWIDVPSVEGSFVINLGETLQAMTGNYLVATAHRVITAGERYSAGYFHGPSLDVSLAPLPLDDRFAAAVAASPHHRTAGFMASIVETESGVGDMASSHRPSTYGEQLWNYFSRSYPDNVAHHYG